jgi:Protein of unknown function (DUF3015)
MKKLAIGLVIAAMSTSALAKDYGAAGCGVGAIIFDGQSGLGPHVLAATTNGFYGTQTFAMSSGTLGCDVTGKIEAHTALYLIDGNMESVAQAIAAGEGESLAALADAFKINAADVALFNKTLKNNFAEIYTNDSVSSTEVHSAILAVMKREPSLVKYLG